MGKRMKYLIIGALATGLTVAGAIGGGIIETPFKAADASVALNDLSLEPAPAAFIQVAQIDAPVATGFGMYEPYPVPAYRATVGLREPDVAQGFSNVATGTRNFSWSDQFDSREQRMLLDNNMVARPEGVASFGAVYMLAEPGTSSFVTTDAVLHGLKTTLREAYRQLERDHMAPVLAAMLGELSANLGRQIDAERNPNVRTDMARLLAYVQTAYVLLDPSIQLDSRVADAVEAELDKIDQAAGPAPSSVFPTQRIDYSRFVPTGHYALNDDFERYYQARTWLQEIDFNMRSADGSVDVSSTRTALLLVRTMDLLADEGEFRTMYESIRAPLAFFDGSSRADMSWDMLAGSARSYYGKLMVANAGLLADDKDIAEFVPYLERNLPRGDRDGVGGFRMIARGHDPAAFITDQLHRAGEASQGSAGLDLMAALGSERASRITGGQGEKAPSILAQRPVEEWVQSLQASLLYTVEPLLETPDDLNGYPRFMRGNAWRDRQLGTALGAWADFQSPIRTLPISVAQITAGSSAPAPVAAGYVEPNPEAWSRIASLAGYMRNGLSSGLYGPFVQRELIEKLRDIEHSAARLMRISAAELEGTALDDEQLAFIASMGERIAAYETFTDPSLKADGATIVASVANNGRQMSPATGHPLVVYVIVPRNDGSGGLMLTRGAVYSYYETDASPERWERMLTTADGTLKPDLRWIESYVNTTAAFAQPVAALRSVTGTLTEVASYDLTEKERKRILPTAQLSLESNVVRRSQGELWFTVTSQKLDGTSIIISVINSGGQQVFRSSPERLDRGQRYDLVRVDGLQSGQYFIRISDLADRTLASGRFMVVQ
jgi:hypothetical protein